MNNIQTAFVNQPRISHKARNTTQQHLTESKFPLLFAIAHIPLGVLLYRSNLLALIHPLIVFSLGLYYAVRRKEKIEKSIMVVAYIIGSEVLWRMAKAPIFWESGKYAAIAILFIALIVRGYRSVPIFPLLYLIFLIPSCILTLMLNSLGDAKDNISYNMSGPFSLFIACCFFSNITLDAPKLKKILLMVAVPLISIAVVTLFNTVTAESLAFSDNSNFSTSGGFGPNQVSSMLGLGVFVCTTIYLIFKNRAKDTLFLSVLILFFAAQSVLTFSRGGMYNAIGGIVFVIFIQMLNPAQGIKKLIPIAVVGVLFLALVFPFLNDFTGGSLQNRFEDTQTTGRSDIVEADLQIFSENPLFGVGVGQVADYHGKMLDRAYVSHTEFARLISEHGIFGVFALLFLLIGTAINFLRQKSSAGKALAAGAVVWSSLFMMNAGMRVAAPSFMWGLSFITISFPRSPRRKIESPVEKN